MDVRLGLDPGLALRTRQGTGYYKVRSLEECFDRARLSDEYHSKGFNPPGTRQRALTGHQFGLDLADEDRQALIRFLKTL